MKADRNALICTATSRGAGRGRSPEPGPTQPPPSPLTTPPAFPPTSLHAFDTATDNRLGLFLCHITPFVHWSA